MHASVSETQTFAITGFVMEAPPNPHPISGARVQILIGPHTFSDDHGAFAITGLPAGRTLIEFSMDGYQTFETSVTIVDRDLPLTIDLYPIPPKNADGVSATARCNDKSWTWAQTQADACATNGGIAYPVCPGPLCTP
jgi:hypothetical protein